MVAAGGQENARAFAVDEPGCGGGAHEGDLVSRHREAGGEERAVRGSEYENFALHAIDPPEVGWAPSRAGDDARSP
jgi:hypothetical protein